MLMEKEGRDISVGRTLLTWTEKVGYCSILETEVAV
jgi:hypothetical protein